MARFKVLYFGFSDVYRCKIIEYLFKEYEWEPVYIAGQNPFSIAKWLSSNFEKCILQDAMQLRQARFDYKKLEKEVPIDESIIDALSKYEINFLGFLHDTTGWNYSFHERKSFYYDILKYWNTVINRLKPDLFVSFTIPHTPAEYSLYLLCKYYYNINVIYINPLPLFDQDYYFIGSSIYNMSEPFIDLYKSETELKPGKEISAYLEKLQSKDGKAPEYILDVYKTEGKNIKKNLWSFLKTLVKSGVSGTGDKKGFLDWKKNRKPYYSMESRMNILDYQLFLHCLAFNNFKLKSLYNSYCTNVNLEDNFIYFPSPYQPESVTAINGGVYEDVFLVLEILSATIPDGWFIYYKEHPGTFRIYAKGSLKRDKNYYDKVKSFHNVKIISYDENSFNLIDSSKAVASIAGTSTWEAAVRGIPALCFGSAWYDGCKSIFKISTLEDCFKAIEEIKKGFMPNIKDIEKYLAAIEKIAVKNIVHYDFNKNILKCENQDYEMQKIAVAIKESHDRLYKSAR